MNTKTMTNQDIMDRMGALANELDAREMRKLIADYDDTDNISDRKWFALAARACESAYDCALIESLEALRGLVKVIDEAMPPDYTSQPYTASRLSAAKAVLAKLEGGEK